MTSFMTYPRVCNQINTSGATSGAGTAYPSETLEFTPFLVGLVLLDLQFPVQSFGLTRSRLEHTIYRIRDEHTNHHTTDVVTYNILTIELYTGYLFNKKYVTIDFVVLLFPQVVNIYFLNNMAHVRKGLHIFLDDQLYYNGRSLLSFCLSVFVLHRSNWIFVLLLNKVIKTGLLTIFQHMNTTDMEVASTLTWLIKYIFIEIYNS